MDKEDVVCIYNKITLGHRKKIKYGSYLQQNRDGPRDYQTEWSVRQRDTYCVSFTCEI